VKPGGLRWLDRAEYLALMLGIALLVAWHVRAVSWGHFALAFALLDLVGYLPGARAYRRAGGRPIARIYHHLYNVSHNFLTLGAVIALWALATRGFEWAMLALPLHLAGDRGLFGNGWKPPHQPFEATAARGAR
jgi:hypothetical protein